MKKIIIALICLTIISVFVALNYLLWERDKNKNSNEMNNVTINALSEKIKSLESTNFRINNKDVELEALNKTLSSKNEQLELEKNKLKENIDNKSEVILQFKQNADLTFLNAKIKSFVDEISLGQYENSYKMISKQFLFPGENSYPSLIDFTNYFKNSVKTIKLKESKINIDNIIDEKKADLAFKVVLDIKRSDNDSKNIFIDGTNDRIINLTFDKGKNEWQISSFSSIQP